MHKQISDRKVAANQSNARKSTGPKTVPAKVRPSLNSFKHGAYANLDTRHREIMLSQKPGARMKYETIDEQSGHVVQRKDVSTAEFWFLHREAREMGGL